MDYQLITVDSPETAGLATITINRPDVLNALSADVLTELNTAVAELELDEAVRCVAITGAGKAFVAGADIAEMQQMGPREALAFAEAGAHLMRSIEESDVPFIAAVNGFALGGGCELALACDFIYASHKAKFGQPEVKLGVIPGFGGTQRLLRRVGVAKAKELIFTGDIIGADEAHRIGLCDAVVDPDALLDKVHTTAAAIAANGPLAVSEAKRAIHEGQSMGLPHGILFEMQSFAQLFATEDQSEGMAAFLAKRKAEFSGR